MDINKILPRTDVVKDLNASPPKASGEDRSIIPGDQPAPLDRVVLSNDYRELAQAAKTKTSDDVRWDKIDHIRSQLSDGTYQIDPEAIAKKMLNDTTKPSYWMLNCR
jgi:flagellar biosynthesis anti-sigma factor FlgM